MKVKLECVVPVRLDRKTHDMIQELADLNSWSLSHVCRKLIAVGLAVVNHEEDPE